MMFRWLVAEVPSGLVVRWSDPQNPVEALGARENSEWARMALQRASAAMNEVQLTPEDLLRTDEGDLALDNLPLEEPR